MYMAPDMLDTELIWSHDGGLNWNPQMRAPLTEPGVNARAGEYLLAVNGRNLTTTENVYSFFQNTANKQIVIRVGPNTDGAGSREVTVVPVPNEGGLRTLAWIEGNRRKVDQMTGGKLAYVWLPDTAGGGYTNFNRYYFAQLHKQGAVIDERFNGGGHAADYIIDYLRKPLNSYWAVRDGEDFRQPFGTLPGPKVMIINEYAGSGGDYMPWMFRRHGIGPGRPRRSPRCRRPSGAGRSRRCRPSRRPGSRAAGAGRPGSWRS